MQSQIGDGHSSGEAAFDAQFAGETVLAEEMSGRPGSQPAYAGTVEPEQAEP